MLQQPEKKKVQAMIDEETFVDEVEAMERTLYRVSRSLLKSPEDCADAVQEALTRAWAWRGQGGSGLLPAMADAHCHQ